MEFHFWFDAYTWDGPLYILRGHRLLFPHRSVFLLLKILFVIANSVDPDEMPHNVFINMDTFRSQ